MQRRRLNDLLEEAFDHACVFGDLETAIELANVVERREERWRRSTNAPDRRNGSAVLTRMRTEIARRQQLPETPPE